MVVLLAFLLVGKSGITLDHIYIYIHIPIESSHQVSMVILLDPRSLLPMDVNVEKAFEDSGKLLGCAFSLAGTGDRDALFRGEIPLRHYVMLEKILLRSFHVSQSIF